MANVKISALDTGVDPSTTGTEFATVQSNITVKTTYEQIEAAVLAAADAAEIDSDDWTATPAQIYRVSMSNTSYFVAGDPAIITQAGVAKYFIVTAVSTNSYIDVAGPTLSTTTITKMQTARRSRVVQVDLFMPGSYLIGGNTSALLSRETRTLFRWTRPASYLCYAAARHAVQDTDSSNQPTLNILIGGSQALATDITMPDSASWVVADAATAGTSVLADYAITFGEALEVQLVSSLGNLDARDLIISLGFVIGN